MGNMGSIGNMEDSRNHSISLTGRKYISSLANTLLTALTLGLFWVAARLSPAFEIFCKTTSSSLADADCVLVRDPCASRLFFVQKRAVVPTARLRRYTRNGLVSILDLPYGRLLYDHLAHKYASPPFGQGGRFEEIYKARLRLGHDAERQRLYEDEILYGDNVFGIEVQTTPSIVLRSIINPYFLWQISSVVIWLLIQYYSYAIIFGGIYTWLFLQNLVEDIRYRNELVRLDCKSAVRVFRFGRFTAVSEEGVYPGDLVQIENSENFKCDARILKGDVVTNESFLTGESVPIYKGPDSVVYAGTKVIKSAGNSLEVENDAQMGKLVKVKNLFRKSTASVPEQAGRPVDDGQFDPSIGLVVKTGKRTKRGQLLKNLSSRRPVSDRLTADVKSINTYSFYLSVLATAASFAYLHYHRLPLSMTVEFSLDIAITFFNPALFSSMELSAQHARRVLASKEINTLDCSYINAAGEVDTAVFDKTGTLTELGVDIRGVDTGDAMKTHYEQLGELEALAMSTCHTVMELDGKYSGDVLDTKMFMFTGSSIENRNGRRIVRMARCADAKERLVPLCRDDREDGDNDCRTVFFGPVDGADESSATPASTAPSSATSAEVLSTYEFDSYLKRMSVVVRSPDGRTLLFCKGAPDSLCKILDKSLPGYAEGGYAERANEYSLQGYRVLALAYRELTGIGGRADDESRLTFLCLVIFANQLKPETAQVIHSLRNARIDPKMCTGDSILTAISVARECGMLDRDVPVLFPVLDEAAGLSPASVEAEWYCVAEEDYVFDKIRLSLYSEFDRSADVAFVVACEGREYEHFRTTSYRSFILDCGVVFARFNPENKKCLVEDYGAAGRKVFYCGDGANDTGALTASFVGLSLATNEACLAAPFSSRSLAAVIELIREGRSALVLSVSQLNYGLFNQLLSGFQIVSLLVFLSFPSDLMSLLSDVTSGYILVWALCQFRSSEQIHPRRPSYDLRRSSLCVCIECVLVSAVSFACLLFVKQDPPFTGQISVQSARSTLMFFVLFVLFTYKAYLLADCGPHRAPRRSSRVFLVTLGCCVAVPSLLFYGLLSNIQPIIDRMDFKALDRSSRLLMTLCSVVSIMILWGSKHFLPSSA